MKKRLAALATIGSLAACAPTQGPVFCHEWNASEKVQVKAALTALPSDSTIHPVIRDYERVCRTLAK
jgi:hypothetical protein